MVSNEAQLPFQPPAVQLQLRKLCLSHLVAAARFAVFAQRVPVLEGAAKACWNVCTPLMDTAEGRSIVTEALEDLAGLMCELKCQDTSFQVLTQTLTSALAHISAGDSTVVTMFLIMSAGHGTDSHASLPACLCLTWLGNSANWH